MNQRLKLTLCAWIGLTGVVLAGPEKESYVNVANGDKPGVYDLYYNAPTQGNLRLLVRDAQGFVLYRAHWKQVENQARRFDLRQLPAGNYVFELEDATGHREVTVAHGLTAAPQLRVDLQNVSNKRYRLVVQGERATPVAVHIYDSNHNLIRSDVVETREDFSRVYDLSQLPTPNVKFEVSTDQVTLATFDTK